MLTVTQRILSSQIKGNLRIASKFCQPQTIRNSTSGSYPLDGKTKVSILNHDLELGLMINTYSQLGFRLNNGINVIGSMAIFPR